MKKSNLYTRTGDTGQTSLVGGSRTSKADIRLHTYGTIDEISSHLGLMAAMSSVTDEIKGQIHIIQHKLFNIGTYLATPDTTQPPRGLTADDIATLEGWIDVIDEQNPPQRTFILPGGSPGAAQAHVARTVCRRAERLLVEMNAATPIAPEVIRYVNRLSDYLFAAARQINFMAGVADIPWDQNI